MKKLTLLFLLLTTLMFTTWGQVELTYDNGDYTDWEEYIFQRQYAVQFTPEGPCRILEMKYYIQTTNAAAAVFGAFIYEWTGSEPGDAIYEEGTNTVAGNFEGWKIHEVGDDNFPVMADGDFVGAFKSGSAFLAIAYDNDLNTGRSWLKQSGDWGAVDYTYLIRAVVQYPTGKLEELIGHSLKVHPNPSATTTTIEYELPEPMQTVITIYNQYGTQVDRIKEFQQAGLQKVNWDALDKSAGIYFFTLEAGKSSTSGKIVVAQ